MAYDLDTRLVIGLASSALFDLTESDKVFRESGEELYRKYQRDNETLPLDQGVAFSFIKQLLSLNDISPDDPLVEVVLMSRNDPDTGLRVMNSISYYKLDITRAVFLQGRTPHKFIPAFSISLFLSANEQDVNQAILAGYPAGRVLDSRHVPWQDEKEVRVAFDFDGVIADDESESVFQDSDIEKFHRHETDKVAVPHNPGPLREFLQKLSDIQQKELHHVKSDLSYEPRLRISIVTAPIPT